MAAKLRKLGVRVLESPAIKTAAKQENIALLNAFSFGRLMTGLLLPAL